MAKENDAIRLRMFSPDGTEDFCGNGLRCAAQHVHTLGWVGDSFTIRHLGRDVPIRFENGRIVTTLGSADYTPENIPLIGPELFNTTIWSGMDGGTPISLLRQRPLHGNSPHDHPDLRFAGRRLLPLCQRQNRGRSQIPTTHQCHVEQRGF